MSKKGDDRILFAWIATFFTIIGFIVAILVKKKDAYVMFYAKQGLVLFLISLVASILSWIPIIGWILMVFAIILWVIAWINALSGERRNTILVGDLAEKINL